MFACLNLLNGHRKCTVYLSCGNFFPEFFFNWSLQYLWLHHFFHSLCFLCVFLLPWPISEVCLYLVFCKKSDFGFVFLDCVFYFICVVLSCCFDYSDDFLSLVRCFLLCFWSASNLFVAIYFFVKFLSQVLKAAPLFPFSPPHLPVLEQYLNFSLFLFLTVLCLHCCVWGFLWLWQVGPTLQLQCAGFSCCGAGALGCSGLSSCGTWGSAALRHAGSSQTRDWTCVPCIGRQDS